MGKIILYEKLHSCCQMLYQKSSKFIFTMNIGDFYSLIYFSLYKQTYDTRYNMIHDTEKQENDIQCVLQVDN